MNTSLSATRAFVAGLSGWLVVLGALFCPPVLGDPTTASLKANLDLPFDAWSMGEDEEEAPEIVLFYGQVYEASAVVFALDNSASMKEHGRWDEQRRQVSRAISVLSPRAAFDVLFFNHHMRTFRRAPVAAEAPTKRAGVAFVLGEAPAGFTCIAEGLVLAIRILKKSRSPNKAVIITSDGLPVDCRTGKPASPEEMNAIIARTLVANSGGDIKVHTIFVGTDTGSPGSDFLRRVAAAHGGTFRGVNDK